MASTEFRVLEDRLVGRCRHDAHLIEIDGEFLISNITIMAMERM